MAVKFSVKTRIRINGREYGSVEELPADAREAFERAMSAGINTATSGGPSRSGSTTWNVGPSVLGASMTFNGCHYGSVDEMPVDVRRLYEGIRSAVDADRDGIPDVLKPGVAPPPARDFAAEIDPALRASASRAGRAFGPSFSAWRSFSIILLLLAGLLAVWALVAVLSSH